MIIETNETNSAYPILKPQIDRCILVALKGSMKKGGPFNGKLTYKNRPVSLYVTIRTDDSIAMSSDVM